MSRSINSNRPGGIAVVVSSVAIVLVAFSFVVVGCGSDDSNSAAAAATANVVRATERQRLKALLEDNYDVANKLHAEDFELINPAGEVLSKEGYIDSAAHSPTPNGSPSRRSGCGCTAIPRSFATNRT